MEDSALQVWTFILRNRRIKYDKQALLASIKGCKSHGLDLSEGSTLDLKMWERAGRYIPAAATIADDSIFNVLKPWRLILQLLRQLGNKQDTRTAKEMLQAPLTKALARTGHWARQQEAWVLCQACGGGGGMEQPHRTAKPHKATKLPGEGITCPQNILQPSRTVAATPGGDDMPAEHPSAAAKPSCCGTVSSSRDTPRCCAMLNEYLPAPPCRAAPARPLKPRLPILPLHALPLAAVEQCLSQAAVEQCMPLSRAI